MFCISDGGSSFFQVCTVGGTSLHGDGSLLCSFQICASLVEDDPNQYINLLEQTVQKEQ